MSLIYYLIVFAVGFLVGRVYQRSKTFRAVVDKVETAAKNEAGALADKAKEAIEKKI